MAACGCNIVDKKTKVELMFQGSAPDDSICQAIEDAEIFVECHGTTYSHNYHDVLVRYYACHLLLSWGFAKNLTSTGFGPVSESRQVAQYGDKEGADPYITKFRELLGAEDELISSI